MAAPRTPIARADELRPGQMKTVEVAGRRLLLANAEGEYYLIDEMCSHEDYSLALGCIKERKIKCSLHGSWFDLRSGEPLDEPASEPITTYTVAVEDDTVYALLG